MKLQAPLHHKDGCIFTLIYLVVNVTKCGQCLLCYFIYIQSVPRLLRKLTFISL